MIGDRSSTAIPMAITVFIVAFILALLAFEALADGPVYIKGDGEQHSISCTPPTARATNAQGVQVPITQAELDHATVYLYQGGDFFSNGTRVSGPIITDIFCNMTWNVDDFTPGDFSAQATVTDTEGRTSEVSIAGGPFVLQAPALMPPAPPVMNP